MSSTEEPVQSKPTGKNVSAGQPRPAWREATLFALVAVVMGWFYLWTVRTEDTPWRFGERQTDYYNLLVDGMLEGHLSMKVDVPPQLLALSDPYNPENRPPGMGLHDASLYHGRYYLYFGIAPVVTLLLPFRLLTHTALPLPAAIFVFTYLGYLAASTTWWKVRRRYFPSASLALSAILLLALGTACLVPVLVRRGNIWELPLSGGYCFSSLAILCLYQSLHARRPLAGARSYGSPERGPWWYAAASLALGLAIASRPTYLYATGLIFVPLLWRWWSARSCEREQVAGNGPAHSARNLLSFAFAGILPLAAVGLGMATYNYARFGSPTEFGVAYQFSGIYEAKARHFSWSYVPYNLRLYGFAPLDWSRYFPFAHDAKLAPPPAGHFGIEEVCGVLNHVWLLWLAVLAPLALWRRAAGERMRLIPLLGGIAALGLGTMTTLGFFYAAIGRYETDFMPAFIWLACVGVLGIERAVQERRPRAVTAARAALGGLALTSAGFGVLFSLVIYGNFQRSNPAAFARLARWADYPAFWLERRDPNPFGAVEMDVQFPPTTAARREPLLRVGWHRAGDLVFVEYGDAPQVRIGYTHDGGGQALSQWIAIDPKKTYHVRIDLGSLFPPEQSPWYDGMPTPVRQALTRRLRVALDAEVLLDGYQHYPLAAPDAVKIGHQEDSDEFAPRFSGIVRDVTRDSRVPTSSASANGSLTVGDQTFGRVTMRVTMPAVRPIGEREPLVTTGMTGGADFLYVEYLDREHVRFGLEHWGKPGVFSPTLVWPDGASHHLSISLGSFPAYGLDATHARRVQVSLDGRQVWSDRARFYRPDPADVFIGENPVGGTACTARFSGTISDVTRTKAE